MTDVSKEVRFTVTDAPVLRVGFGNMLIPAAPILAAMFYLGTVTLGGAHLFGLLAAVVVLVLALWMYARMVAGLVFYSDQVVISTAFSQMAWNYDQIQSVRYFSFPASCQCAMVVRLKGKAGTRCLFWVAPQSNRGLYADTLSAIQQHFAAATAASSRTETNVS